MTSVTQIQEQVLPEELQAAHKTAQAFASAFKSYAIYPEDHVFCRTNLEKFRSQLESFLDKYQELPLTVDKNTFLYKGEKIFENPPEENNPAHLLTRDGLVKLVFLQEIESAELTTLLQIFNSHRSGSEETGGDIVTSLWQAEFQHIEYDEVDIFALEAFNFDLGTLKVAPAATGPIPLLTGANGPEEHPGGEEQERKSIAELTATEDEAVRPESLADKETVSNLLNLEKAITVLELTPEEEAILQSYVKEEEQKDYSNDVVDVMLIILVSQKNQLHFSQVLEFLEEVFFDALNKGKFHLADKLCSNVLNIGKQIKTLRPWTQDLLADFMFMLSSEEKWAKLSWMKNPQVLMLNRGHLKYLWHVFSLLPSESMFALGQCIGGIDTSNIHIRNELYSLVENKAKDDPDKFGAMLSRADEKVNTILFSVVDTLDSLDAANISLKVTSHESPQVRKMGLDRYFAYVVSPDLDALYPLLNDEDDVVVGKLLAFLLSHAEEEEVEGMLLRYLEQTLRERVERAHMFEYYKALSMCGSYRSVKVLEKILLESKVSEIFNNVNAVHKKGSALALKALGSEEALSVLYEGKKSLRPDIRMACQFALEKMK